MKLWKHTLITAVAFFGIAGTVLYSSCEKDTCDGLQCKNGGSCAEGFCRCPVGFEGTECETMAGTKFVGMFVGNYTCPATSPLKDTVTIWFEAEPNRMKLVQTSRVHDTLVGTASKDELLFEEQTSGNYRRYTKATMQDKKLTIFLEEVQDVNNPATKKTCNFIGFQ